MDRRVHRIWAKLLGPFAFQMNSSTRAVEYPWAFHVATLSPGMRVLELGGALSGFQFVLAASGARVTNVDPFFDYGVGPEKGLSPVTAHRRLNRAFRTDVALRPTVLPDARLAGESMDRAYCLSVIEHLPADDRRIALREVNRVLKPGGLFVITVDLFVNLQPFTTRDRNQWGTNVSVRQLADEAQMALVWGEKSELLGFEGFRSDSILSNLDRYCLGADYPVLAQLLVLQKPGGSSLAPAELRGDVFGGGAHPRADAGC